MLALLSACGLLILSKHTFTSCFIPQFNHAVFTLKKNLRWLCSFISTLQSTRRAMKCECRRYVWVTFVSLLPSSPLSRFPRQHFILQIPGKVPELNLKLYFIRQYESCHYCEDAALFPLICCKVLRLLYRHMCMYKVK